MKYLYIILGTILVTILVVFALNYWKSPQFKRVDLVTGKPDTVTIFVKESGLKTVKPVKKSGVFTIKDTVKTQMGNIYLESKDIEQLGIDLNWDLIREKEQITRVDTLRVAVSEPIYSNYWFWSTLVLVVGVLLALIK